MFVSDEFGRADVPTCKWIGRFLPKSSSHKMNWQQSFGDIRLPRMLLINWETEKKSETVPPIMTPNLWGLVGQNQMGLDWLKEG